MGSHELLLSLPAFPHKFCVGLPHHGYLYSWWIGKVWKCVRAPDGIEATDTLFLMLQEEGTTLVTVVAHAPRDTPDVATLMANHTPVFKSVENVLKPGWHHWSWFDRASSRWSALGYFETTWRCSM